MKKLIASLILVSASSAYAVPGSWGLTCTAHKGTKKEIRINAGAADIEGTESGFPSEVNIAYPKKVYDDKNEDGTLAGLVVMNHLLDRVLSVKYTGEKLGFNIWALPNEITADKGSTELEGHATFKAKGYVYAEGEGYQKANFNCSFNYDSGSAG